MCLQYTTEACVAHGRFYTIKACIAPGRVPELHLDLSTLQSPLLLLDYKIKLFQRSVEISVDQSALYTTAQVN
jgi:hypothetical protein